MARRTVGIVMNGVTGRMGYNQQTLRTVIDRHRRHLSAVTDAGRPAPC
jgi:hypothetical protein